MNILMGMYWMSLIVLAVFSYGFIDLNLHLSDNSLFLQMQAPLSSLVYDMRPLASGIFVGILAILFYCYCIFLRHHETYFPTWKKFMQVFLGTALLLTISYPALTHDIFNYITTAKVAFTHQENPYVVMPIEIPNEPYLAFTRAANKLALYGPVWIVMTLLPHTLGAGDIWRTIIAFKLMNAIALFVFVCLVYRITKSMKQVIFFAFNPLVLIETLVSGHNDIFMMLFAISGLFLWRKQGLLYKITGGIAFSASWLVKGATVALVPLFAARKMHTDQILVYAFWIMTAVFFIFAPLREELYPWYAVWLISIASFLSYVKHPRIWEFVIVLSLALELRHVPYMYMGFYGGHGPLLRVLCTVIPVVGYVLFLVVNKKISLWHKKNRS